MTIKWYHGWCNEFTYVFNLNKLKYHLTTILENRSLASIMTCMYDIVNQTDLSNEEYYFDYMKKLLSQLINNYPGVNIVCPSDNSLLLEGEECNLSCIYPIAIVFGSSSGDLLFEVSAIDLSRTDRSNFHLSNKNLNFDFKHHNCKALVYIEFKFTEKDLTKIKDDRLLFDYLLNYYEFDKRLRRKHF